MGEKAAALLLDADVLIDYCQSDPAVLGLVSRHVDDVYVLRRVLCEVKGLDVAGCQRHGLKVIEPDLEQLRRAGRTRGRLSFCDHLCVIVASDIGLVCVTNDRALRRACAQEGVAAMWGLEMMFALVRRQAMSADDAIRVAERIHLANPFHIPKTLVNRFAREAKAIESRRGRNP